MKVVCGAQRNRSLRLRRRRTKRLTPAEENELIHLYRSGVDHCAPSERYANSGRDARVAEAAHRIVEAHVPLVKYVAIQRFKNQDYVDLDDLISAGTEGLILALQRFDPNRRCRFSTYAIWWIRNRMSDLLRKERWSMHIPDGVYRKIARLLRARHRLYLELGREPTVEEIAHATDLDRRAIASLLIWTCRDTVSLETRVGDKRQATLGEFIVDANSSFRSDVDIERGQLHNALTGAMSTLHPRESRVLSLRIGLDGSDEKTLDEVGRLLGMTREGVRRIEVGALRKLRTSSRRRQLAQFVLA